MSAIGDYVHLTFAGYVKEKGEDRGPFFKYCGSALAIREKHFNQWIDKQFSPIKKELEQELQKNLSLLKSFKDNKGNISMVEENEIAMALIEDLWNELEIKYLTVDKIAATSSGLIDSASFFSGTNVGKNGANTFRQQMTVGNINTQIQNLLNNTLDTINKEIFSILSKDDLETKKINDAILKTRNKLNSFILNLSQKMKVIDTSSQKNTFNILQKIFKDLQEELEKNEELNTSINLMNKLNKLAYGLTRGITENQFKGDMAEALIAITARRMSGIALKESNKTISSAMVSGQERSSRGIDTNNFIPGLDWEKIADKESFKRPFGEFIVSADAVQDKVDIKIELEGGEHTYISAKNYSAKSLKDGVTNKSASFLSLIQNENGNNLINHYLNLNAVNGGRATLKRNADAYNNFIRKITIAKLITGYSTIVGLNSQTMSVANVFAVFDSTNYTVNLYDMKDVLNGIFSGNKYQSMYIPQYFFRDNVSAPTPQRRIENLLRKINISVAYTLRESEYAKNK